MTLGAWKKRELHVCVMVAVDSVRMCVCERESENTKDEGSSFTVGI